MKSAGNDTLNCIVDFDKIMPFEWDTLVYIKYDSYSGNSSDELEEYLNFYFGNKKRRSVNGLHFLHKGKVVHKVNLYMMSDDAKGFFLCTEKDFIKRARSDAKFHLIRDSIFFVVRDTTENFVPMITFNTKITLAGIVSQSYFSILLYFLSLFPMLVGAKVLYNIIYLSAFFSAGIIFST